MNYQSILDKFSYNDGKNISDRISNVKKDNYREHKDIINEIILWKSNRFTFITNELINMINNLSVNKEPLEAIKDENTYHTIIMLLKSRGIKLPTASAILHFYYPDIYPIIDQRAYRELYGKEYPHNQKNLDKLVNVYLCYMKDVYDYRESRCKDIPFSKIDKILYQLDKEKGNPVKY